MKPIRSGCWNCGSKDHGFRQCPRPSRPPCHLCGNEAVSNKYECPRTRCREIIALDETQDLTNEQEDSSRSKESAPLSEASGPVQKVRRQESEQETNVVSQSQEVMTTANSSLPPLEEPIRQTRRPGLAQEVESNLRNALEAFWAHHVCDLAPTRPVTILIPEIRITVEEEPHSWPQPTAIIGNLIDIEPEPPVEVTAEVMEDEAQYDEKALDEYPEELYQLFD